MPRDSAHAQQASSGRRAREDGAGRGRGESGQDTTKQGGSRNARQGRGRGRGGGGGGGRSVNASSEAPGRGAPRPRGPSASAAQSRDASTNGRASRSAAPPGQSAWGQPGYQASARASSGAAPSYTSSGASASDAPTHTHEAQPTQQPPKSAWGAAPQAHPSTAGPRSQTPRSGQTGVAPQPAWVTSHAQGASSTASAGAGMVLLAMPGSSAQASLGAGSHPQSHYSTTQHRSAAPPMQALHANAQPFASGQRSMPVAPPAPRPPASAPYGIPPPRPPPPDQASYAPADLRGAGSGLLGNAGPFAAMPFSDMPNYGGPQRVAPAAAPFDDMPNYGGPQRARPMQPQVAVGQLPAQPQPAIQGAPTTQHAFGRPAEGVAQGTPAQGVAQGTPAPPVSTWGRPSEPVQGVRVQGASVHSVPGVPAPPMQSAPEHASWDALAQPLWEVPASADRSAQAVSDPPHQRSQGYPNAQYEPGQPASNAFGPSASHTPAQPQQWEVQQSCAGAGASVPPDVPAWMPHGGNESTAWRTSAQMPSDTSSQPSHTLPTRGNRAPRSQSDILSAEQATSDPAHIEELSLSAQSSQAEPTRSAWGKPSQPAWSAPAQPSENNVDGATTSPYARALPEQAHGRASTEWHPAAAQHHARQSSSRMSGARFALLRSCCASYGKNAHFHQYVYLRGRERSKVEHESV